MSVKAAKGRAAAASKPAKDSPRSQVLPGMGSGVKHIEALDNLFENMAERRGRMATDRGDDADDMRASLALMRQHKRTSYIHAGLEAVRAAGEEKLRVRTTRAEATAEVEDETEDAGPVAADGDALPDDDGVPEGDDSGDDGGDAADDFELP